MAERSTAYTRNELLISQVEKYPMLWNMFNDDYKKSDNKKKSEAWKAIGLVMKQTGKIL